MPSSLNHRDFDYHAIAETGKQTRTVPRLRLRLGLNLKLIHDFVNEWFALNLKLNLTTTLTMTTTLTEVNDYQYDYYYIYKTWSNICRSKRSTVDIVIPSLMAIFMLIQIVIIIIIHCRTRSNRIHIDLYSLIVVL